MIMTMVVANGDCAQLERGSCQETGGSHEYLRRKVLRSPFCNEIIDVKREEKWCCGSASAMSVQHVQSMYSTVL
jgi:hypothetical protein